MQIKVVLLLKQLLSFLTIFLLFYCHNLGNKAKDSVGTGEFYFLSVR